VRAHQRGTRFNIGVDPADGLLRQGEEGYQLTWMDAKVEGRVVTPRRGKAVEINALWFNAEGCLFDVVDAEDGGDDAAVRPNQIFDATPPFQPRGCFAQAWSVAETLRVLLKLRS
jgi:glycogen debranching enzyme